MQLAAVFFALAALGGLTIAGIRLSGTPRPPTWLALGHGAIAATGLVTLIYAAATQPLPRLALIALGCFVLSALGGVCIFTFFHHRVKPLLFPLVFGHGSLSVLTSALLFHD